MSNRCALLNALYQDGETVCQLLGDLTGCSPAEPDLCFTCGDVDGVTGLELRYAIEGQLNGLSSTDLRIAIEDSLFTNTTLEYT